MRWMGIPLIPLIILLAASPALAPWHDLWFAPPPGVDVTPHLGRVLQSLILVVVLVAVLAWFVVRFLGAKPSRAIFLAGVSIPTMLFVGDYVFALLFRTREAEGTGQLAFLTVFDYVLLAVLLVWSASWTLNRPMTTRDVFSAHVFRSLVGPVVLTTVLAWFLHR